MEVSVITPTIRKEGLDLVKKALDGQDYNDFEWLIGSPFDPEIPGAKWVKDEFGGGFWSLNRIYNKLFKEAQGNIIVTLQDFIWIPPDGIEKFVDNINMVGGIHTGVGDQYSSIDKYGIPHKKVWEDPRRTNFRVSMSPTFFNNCEWNWAAFEREKIFLIGGMDEQLDFLGFGGDQFQVCDRWHDVGETFYIDYSNESYTLRHDRSSLGGEKYWDDNHVLLNGKYDQRKSALKSVGMWPRLINL